MPGTLNEKTYALALMGVSALLLSSRPLLVSATVSGQATFTSARLLGNESVASLAYNGTLSRTYQNKTMPECGLLCAIASTCDSFNFATSVGESRGRCDVLANENLYSWYPRKFIAPQNENSTFFINALHLRASFFKLIPAVGLGVNSETQFPWLTDCMNQGGTAGFMVAMRNNNPLTSVGTTDFKCRIFEHSFAMSQEPSTLAWYYNTDGMRCPNGSVITAVYDAQNGFDHADTVRCQKPAFPWVVNATTCIKTNVLKKSGDPYPSLLYDPGLKGTADSIWSAQCAGSTADEVWALVGIKLLDNHNERVDCCALYRSN